MASNTIKNVYLNDYYSIVGPLEHEGKLYDVEHMKDYYFGTKSIEKAEVKINEVIINKLKTPQTNLIISGNLSNQLANISYALKNKNMPFLGIYSACATFCEGLILASLLLENKKDILVVTSSHNLNSEKQFRYPIEYGGPRPSYSTYTVTGGVGVTVSKKTSNIKLLNYTIGKVVDYGVKDSANMGAVMAPSALETIKDHYKELGLSSDYYDLILTGDLGIYGVKILNELLKNEHIKVPEIIDAGTLIYGKYQETFSGGSGPTCLPLGFFNVILKKEKFKRILLVGTGSLHSKVLVDQKESIPSISHAVGLEIIE